MTFLITDDVELAQANDMDAYQFSVVIRPRERRPGSRLRSRGDALPLKVWHTKRTSHAAGFPLGGPTVDFDDDDSYYECQRFEIEFEAEREYQDFIDIWEQAIHFRREKKVVLQQIEEKQGREQFTGKLARRLYFHSS